MQAIVSRPGVVGKGDDEHLLRFSIGARDGFHAFEAADAVLEMHDVIVLVQLAEIDLRAARLLAGAAQGHAAGAGVAVAPEELGIAEHRDFRRGEGEAGIERADGELQRVGFDRRDEIVEALDLALVVAENVDAPAVEPPVAELGEEGLALDFIDHEIARLELAETVLKKSRRVVFAWRIGP